MSEVLTLIKCLPLLLGLIKSIQKAIDDAQAEQDVQDHLTKVKDAFDSRDVSKLNDLFNSAPATPVS